MSKPKKEPVKCKKCNEVAVLADAGMLKSIQYLYCRKCKIEIDAYGFKVFLTNTPIFDELDAYFKEEIERLDRDNPLTLKEILEEEEPAPNTLKHSYPFRMTP